MKKIILLFILFILIESSFASEYVVPKKPNSVDVADIDLDGDQDIVIGHDPTGAQGWGGISILLNSSQGEFELIDSLYILCYQPSIEISLIDNNDFPDIMAMCYDDATSTTCFQVIYNYCNEEFNNINIFSCEQAISITQYNSIYLENIFISEIVFISNNNFVWGYLLNDGLGQFSSPVYYDLDYPPVDLAIGDLNGDERDDILVAGGGNLDVWFNYDIGLEYSNLVDSTFTSHILISDVDLDGDNDIVASIYMVPGAPAKFVVFTNDGGIFSQSYLQWIDESMARIYIADLNNDDYPDVIYNCSLYSPNPNNEIFNTYILFNNQNGTFSEPVNYYTGICSHKSHAADLDGNGWNDIITLNYDVYNPPPDTCRIHILFNDGAGNYVEESQTLGIGNNVLNADGYQLMNFPNPFNPSTTINYDLPNNIANPIIDIFNIKGEKIRTLNCQNQIPIIWDGTNQEGKDVSSGIYLYKLKAENKIQAVNKCLLLK